MVTVNDVRYAVHAAIDERFPHIPILGEESAAEGQSEPYFFVHLASVAQDREHDRRYKRSHSFDIRFFPAASGSAVAEAHDVADELYDGMEAVLLDDGVMRGTNMRHELTDGVLHFFVDYRIHMMRLKPEAPKMQTLKQEGFMRE